MSKKEIFKIKKRFFRNMHERVGQARRRKVLTNMCKTKALTFIILGAVFFGACGVFFGGFVSDVSHVYAASPTNTQPAPQATTPTVSSGDGPGGNAESAMSGMKKNRGIESCAGWTSTLGICEIAKGILYGLLTACGYAVTLAITIVTSVADPKIMSIAGRPEIYTMWKVVRDFINLFFILGLLFSAFSTVFQMPKYHLKEKFLTIVLAALLVNFSFPVTRFIIDASNVTGYFMMQQVFGDTNGANMTNRIGGQSNIAELMVGGSGDAVNTSFTYLFLAIGFAAVFALTLLVVAAMFIVRLAMLVVLIIFSPVGFAASIFPATSRYANDWWTNILRFSFLFPAMIFMMIIAIKFMVLVGQGDFSGNAGTGVGGYMAGIIATMAYLTIPIVILWVGVISAAKLGGEAASFVVGRAQKSLQWMRKKAWENKGKLLLVGAGVATGGAAPALLSAAGVAAGGLGAAAAAGGTQGGRSLLRNRLINRDQDGNLVWKWTGRRLGNSYPASVIRRGQAKWDSRKSPLYEKAEKEYEAQLNSMSAGDREAEIARMMTRSSGGLSGALGYKQAVAARVAVKSGSFKNVDIRTARKIEENLRKSGDHDLLGKFRDTRFDTRISGASPADAQRIYQDMIDTNKVGNLSAAQVDSAFVNQVVDTMGPGQIAEFASKLPARVKQRFEEEIERSLAGNDDRNNLTDQAVLNRRSFGAHVSGNADRYFSQMSTPTATAPARFSTVSGNTTPAGVSHSRGMTNFIAGLSSRELARQSQATLLATARDANVPKAFFANVSQAGLNTDTIRLIKSEALTRHTTGGATSVHHYLNNNTYWAGI